MKTGILQYSNWHQSGVLHAYVIVNFFYFWCYWSSYSTEILSYASIVSGEAAGFWSLKLKL